MFEIALQGGETYKDPVKYTYIWWYRILSHGIGKFQMELAHSNLCVTGIDTMSKCVVEINNDVPALSV